MVRRLEKLPRGMLEVIYLSRDLAKKEKTGLYLVGGFVRDLLLGVKNFDLDIVIEKDGIDFAYKLSNLLDAYLVKHRDFGTATITNKDGSKIDIATSRKEFYPEPAVLPLVKQGAIEDDLFRRDFTINAMACHIDFEKFGELVDFFGGVKDLRQGCIRFLHEKSFIDDPTRIIRAVRFEQRLGFVIEEKTLYFIRQAKKIRMLEKVSKHRLRDELILIFKERHPYKILNRLNKIYNLSFIDRDIKLSNNSKSIFNAVDKAAIWFKDNFSQRRGLDIWLMYLTDFLSVLNIKKLHSLLADYAFNRNQRIRILSFKKNFNKIDRDLSKESVSALKLHRILDSLSYEVIMLSYAVSKRYKTKQRIKEFFHKHHLKKIFVTGEDLLSLGLKPGPRFKKIFRLILNAKINDRVHNKTEELELVRRIIGSK